MNLLAAVASRGQQAATKRLELYAECDHVEVRRGDGWLAVATGVVSNDMNGVVSDPAAFVAEHVIDELIAWFIDKAMPASWIVAAPNPLLTAALAGRGAVPERSGWWAGRSLDRSTIRRAQTGAAVRRVRSDADLEGWLDVAEQCGWIDDDRDRAARADLYREVGLDHPNLCHWIAAHGRAPIGMATSLLDGDIIDLCNLAVIEAERRHGVGAALVDKRLHDGMRKSATMAVAALSPDGWKLYQPLGFESVPVAADTWFYLPLTSN